jgi:hypothetical protein
LPGVNQDWIENRNEIFYSIPTGAAGFGLGVWADTELQSLDGALSPGVAHWTFGIWVSPGTQGYHL